jgi:hypothetical protein
LFLIIVGVENAISHKYVDAKGNKIDMAWFDNSGYSDMMEIQNVSHVFS